MLFYQLRNAAWLEGFEGLEDWRIEGLKVKVINPSESSTVADISLLNIYMADIYTVTPSYLKL